MTYSHVPVLQTELVRLIENSKSGGEGILADCTVGEGGHSEVFLKRFKKLQIIAFDRDKDILIVARERLERYGDRINFINDNFSHISQHLEKVGDGIFYVLYDFGISSFHFERSGRGFSFSIDEVLDMRLDSTSHDARYIINRYDRKILADILYRYGEERWSRRIASAICEARKEKEIQTTRELAEIVLRAIPSRFHVKNIHPATRVFQALRIAVNDELNAIESSLEEVYRYVQPGGLIMAISFHSLEDRIVKNIFRRLARGCTCREEPRHCQCDSKPFVKILTKKPVVPDIGEIEENKRARSARLRACERL